MEQARLTTFKLSETRDTSDVDDLPMDVKRGPGSVVSLGSGLAHHARSIVGSFTCAGQPDAPEPMEQLKRTPTRTTTPSRVSRRGRSRTQREDLSQGDV
jgi:hypothetical protein